MPSLRARLAQRFLRRQLAGWSEGDTAQQRARQAAASRLARLPRSARYQSVIWTGCRLNGSKPRWPLRAWSCICTAVHIAWAV